VVTAAVQSSNAPPPPLRKYPVCPENQRDSKCGESQPASSWCMCNGSKHDLQQCQRAHILVSPNSFTAPAQIYAHRKPARQPMGNPQLSCRAVTCTHCRQRARSSVYRWMDYEQLLAFLPPSTPTACLTDTNTTYLQDSDSDDRVR